MEHFIFHSEKQGELWYFTHVETCICHIGFNHWAPRATN
jgi:hypothetical protein